MEFFVKILAIVGFVASGIFLFLVFGFVLKTLNEWQARKVNDMRLALHEAPRNPLEKAKEILAKGGMSYDFSKGEFHLPSFFWARAELNNSEQRARALLTLINGETLELSGYDLRKLVSLLLKQVFKTPISVLLVMSHLSTLAKEPIKNALRQLLKDY